MCSWKPQIPPENTQLHQPVSMSNSNGVMAKAFFLIISHEKKAIKPLRHNGLLSIGEYEKNYY